MKTHWKKHFNYDYIGVYSLVEGQDLILTIQSISNEDVTGANGKKEKCCVVKFSDHKKDMILNRTNAKTIEAIYKTPYVEEWKGKKIQLFRETGIRAFGSVTDGLRIRPFAPKKKTEKETLFEQVRNAFRTYNGSDKEQIQQMLVDKKKNNEVTVDFLKNTLKTLSNERV